MIILRSLKSEVAEQALKAKQNKVEFDGRVGKTKQVLHAKATSPQALLACAATGAMIGSMVTGKTKTKPKNTSLSVASPHETDNHHSGNRDDKGSSTVRDAETHSVLSQIADKLLAQSTDVMINLFTAKATQMAADVVKKKQQGNTGKSDQKQT